MTESTKAPRVPPPAYPALRRLSWWQRRRRIPHVQQLEWTDCGAACLVMVMRYFGCDTRLEDLREDMSLRDGADALSLLRLGERHGLRGRGIKLEATDLRHLPRGAVLHWEFKHFVVFDRKVRGGVEIVDPGAGLRRISEERFARAFTGVALVFEPTEALAPRRDRSGRPRWSYLWRMLGHGGLIARVLATSVLLRVLALGVPLLTALIVDRVVPRGDLHLLTVVGIGIAGLLGFQILSSLLRGHLLLQLRTNIDTRVTLGFLDHLAALPYGFFQRRSTGDLMMRVASNTTIREILTGNTLSALIDGLLVLVYLALVFVMHPGLGMLTAALGVLQVLVYVFARGRVATLMKQDLEAQAQAQSHLTQMLAGMETLKCAGVEQRSVERWSHLFVDELNVALRRGRLQTTVDAAMSVLQLGSPLLILCAGALAVLQGDLSLGVMLALGALAGGFLAPLSSLVRSALDLSQLGSYFERLDDVLSAEREQAPGEGMSPGRLRGAIDMQGVSFRYGPRSPLVVRDVSLSIAPGSSVAIVGTSGSGKSTLAKLLLGLYTPTDGAIRYDGQGLATLDRRELRRQLGAVPQAPFIFGHSVRDNVAMGDPSITLDTVIEACKVAAIHDDVMAMPMAYDTIVADGGASLSGGQRQRLALARALVRSPAVLLLDEATSSLDAATEKRVMDGLAALSCVRVIIAQRLSTIAFADTIVVMDQGRVAEVGTHDDLLARRGIYFSLVAAQAAGVSAGEGPRAVG